MYFFIEGKLSKNQNKFVSHVIGFISLKDNKYNNFKILDYLF